MTAKQNGTCILKSDTKISRNPHKQLKVLVSINLFFNPRSTKVFWKIKGLFFLTTSMSSSIAHETAQYVLGGHLLFSQLLFW